MSRSTSENGAPPAILAEGLRKQYGDRVAVDDVSFSIGPGEVVGFLGPNGAGKTTTMRMLTGFLPATDGSVSIKGHDIFLDAWQRGERWDTCPKVRPSTRR